LNPFLSSTKTHGWFFKENQKFDIVTDVAIKFLQKTLNLDNIYLLYQILLFGRNGGKK